MSARLAALSSIPSCLGVRVEVWLLCGFLRGAHVDTQFMSISYEQDVEAVSSG